MHFLVMGKRQAYFALLVILIVAGLTRWNIIYRSENTNPILSPTDSKNSGHTNKVAILQKIKISTPAPELPALSTPTALLARDMIEGTAVPITASEEAITLALTPTLAIPAQPISDTLAVVANLPSLEDFIQQVSNGRSDLVRGIYVTSVMALRVVPQPQGDPGFISAEDGTATLFQSASDFGVTGLLAHNFLSGREFFHLKSGQTLIVIYGDGHLGHYRVSQIVDFQRLSLNDLRSNFLELNSGIEKTADQLFADFYEGQPHLTLQTCIERDGIWSWGVRFIKAEPVG